MHLLNKETIEFIIKDDKFCSSHLAREDFLGAGSLYYSLAYMTKSKLSVCLGSGSGFVPKIMRQCQRDLGIETESRTVLVDANLPGWGDPDYHGGSTHFTENFDVEIIKETTRSASRLFSQKSIGYLHIDADHSYEAAKEDLFTYKDFVSPNATITMHDSVVRSAGVWKVIEEIRDNKAFEVVNLPFAMGIAIVRVR